MASEVHDRYKRRYYGAALWVIIGLKISFVSDACLPLFFVRCCSNHPLSP